MALSEMGQVYSWGEGEQGQLGLGDVRSALVPAKVVALRVGCEPLVALSHSMISSSRKSSNSSSSSSSKSSKSSIISSSTQASMCGSLLLSGFVDSCFFHW